jgi:asparagine synthase (glutamine-hydrolysing)
MVLAVREKIVDSIRVRLRADVPVGIYLSGGLDSSAVAGIVKHLVEEEGATMGNIDRIACFCVAFDRNSGFDESRRLPLHLLPIYGRTSTTGTD